MKTKKIPLRSCVVTREKLPKKELIRIVKDQNGDISIDLIGKVNGRGVYLKKDLDVIKKAKSSKVLNKYLDTQVPEKIYEELEKHIVKEEN